MSGYVVVGARVAEEELPLLAAQRVVRRRVLVARADEAGRPIAHWAEVGPPARVSRGSSADLPRVRRSSHGGRGVRGLEYGSHSRSAVSRGAGACGAVPESAAH